MPSGALGFPSAQVERQPSAECVEHLAIRRDGKDGVFHVDVWVQCTLDMNVVPAEQFLSPCIHGVDWLARRQCLEQGGEPLLPVHK